jgi:DNA-binding transcriptional regulator YbjK
MTSAREALDRSTSFASALQSQINGLTMDFINRDDPVQRAQIDQQRVKAVAELERTQREVENNKKAIGAIEEDARKAGVPAGWLR